MMVIDSGTRGFRESLVGGVNSRFTPRIRHKIILVANDSTRITYCYVLKTEWPVSNELIFQDQGRGQDYS
jgi:hypothetical protein